MKNFSTLLIPVFLILFSHHSAISQTVDASPEISTICFGTSASLTATYAGPVVTSTTSYAISTIPFAPDPLTAGTAVALSDDSQTGLLPIGFNFCFFGQTYSQFIICSNNWIGFSSGQTSTWVTAPIPVAGGITAPMNTIMGAWQDINPGVGGTVQYAVYGVAPNRRLSVSWNNVPMYSCTAQIYSSQIIIYETTNIIETHILNKSLCPTWNSGNAVHGLHDPTGTIAFVVPGRNNTQWTTSNEGKRFTPNGPATSTVNWYILPGNTLVGTGTAITVTPPPCQPSTLYYAQVSSVGTCVAGFGTDTVIVNQINCTPCTLTAGNGGPYCVGSTINLTASTLVGATYAWTGPNGFTSTSQNPSIPSSTLLAGGIYTVVATQAAICNSCTATTTVVVNSIPPAPTVSNITTCYGTSVALTASVSGPTYEWFDSPVGGILLGTGATYTTPILFTTTTYYVQSNASGCIGPRTVVTVTVAANFTVNAGLDDSICNGTSTILNAITPTGFGFTYTWNPGTLSGSSVTVTPAATTTYTLSATDALGCSGSDNVTITVGTPLLVFPNGSAATCFSSCDGQGTSTISGSFPPYTYLWNTLITTPTINSLCAGTYTLSVTDMIGCAAQDTIVIIAPSALNLVMSTITSHCSLPDGSATVVVTGGMSGYSYVWTPGGQTTSTAINLIPGAYCVTVTDANGCSSNACATVPNTSGVVTSVTSSTPTSCNGFCNGTATVTAVGGISPYTYLWNNGQTTSTALGLCAGSYTCTAMDASGCTDTASITILQPSPVMIDVIPSVLICIGQSATLTAIAQGGNSGGYTYNWTAPAFTGNPYIVSPTTNTVYNVTATDPLGCPSINTQTATVNIRPPLAVNASNNVAICPGGTTTLTSVASGGDNSYFYNWMPGAGNASSFNVSPIVTTTYTLTLTDGCTTLPATDLVTVTLLPLPNVNFSSNLNSGCAPLCINFIDLTTITGGNAVSWNWIFGGAGASSSQNPNNCFDNAGVYNVSLAVTTDSGCVNTFTFNNMITVNAMPVADFNFGPQPTSVSTPTITFNNLSTNTTQWFWNFGDPASASNTSNLINPYHFYSDTGSFCVTLIVTNTSSCADTITWCLIISPEFTFYIPNSFTPDGNGLNDVFQPKGEYIDEFTMKIYDRWGALAYMSTNFNEGWNGKVGNKGEVAQEDVYVYIINIKDRIGERHQYIGHVTIVK